MIKFCLCDNCECLATVERPDLMNVCETCHEKCYAFGTGKIK